MKKYFKFPAESDLGIGIQYIEFDDDNWPIRQIECYGDRFFNSNERYHKELGCGGLCDQQLTEAGIKLGEQIDAKQFESAWKLSNRAFIPSQISSTKESRNTINTRRLERPLPEGDRSGILNALRMSLSDLRMKLSIETNAETRVILERKIQQIEKFIKLIGKGCLKDENNGLLFTLRKSGSHSRQYLRNKHKSALWASLAVKR